MRWKVKAVKAYVVLSPDETKMAGAFTLRGKLVVGAFIQRKDAVDYQNLGPVNPKNKIIPVEIRPLPQRKRGRR